MRPDAARSFVVATLVAAIVIVIAIVLAVPLYEYATSVAALPART